MCEIGTVMIEVGRDPLCVEVVDAAGLLGCEVADVRRLVANGTLHQHPGTEHLRADEVLRLGTRLALGAGRKAPASLRVCTHGRGEQVARHGGLPPVREPSRRAAVRPGASARSV